MQENVLTPVLTHSANHLDFLIGRGQLGELIAKHPWDKTPLGPIEQWPQSLKTSISIILNSGHPMFVAWGPEQTFIYNDAYINVLSLSKHPWALGRPFSEVWAEIWDTCGPLAEKVFKQAEASFVDNVRLFMKRLDYVEETYFSFSYSPIRGETGTVDGLFCPSTEVTEILLNERRLQTLGELSAKALLEKSVEAACASAFVTLAKNNADIPFALLYLLKDEQALLSQAIGLSKGLPLLSPALINLTDTAQTIWPLADFIHDPKSRVISVHSITDLPKGLANYPLSQAVVLPVTLTGQDKPTAVFIVGVNPCRKLDEKYFTFYELVVVQLATAIQNARAIEDEKKRAEALAKLDQAKTVFFSNISHEFRTPLALMLGPLADSLTDSQYPLPPVQYQRQQLIQHNAQRLLKLVNTLLDFSRIEAGRMQASYTPTDLAKLTVELSSLFEPLLTKAGLQIKVEFEELTEPVYVDTTMWEKIVLNLLSNAFKFTFHGSITLSLKQLKDTVEFAVSDTGAGIPEHELPHLFERFYRVDGAQGRSFEGSGIGLALIQELIKLHGGTVQVKSQQGVGSTFTVKMPLGKAHLPADQIKDQILPASLEPGYSFVDEASRWLPNLTMSVPSGLSKEAQESQPRSVSQSTSPLTNQRILLADDNADMRSYISNILEPHWQVQAVCNGEEAYNAACNNPPALILSDVMMPRMDGFELIKHLRNNPKTNAIPIILLSARAGEEAKVEGLTKGADDYLVKTSFSAKELTARVNIHLELAQLRSHLEQEVQKRTAQLTALNQTLANEIQERIIAEQALSASEARYRLLTSVALVGISHLDKNGLCSYVNPRLMQMFGLTLEQFHQQEWIKLVHPEDKERVVKEWQTFLADANAKLHQTTYRIMLPENKICWIYAQNIPERDEDGAIKGYIGTATDITAQKQLEQEQLAALARAEEEQRNRAKEAESNKRKQDEFIDTVCHEIRNPLNGIVGNVELVEDNFIKQLDNVLVTDDSLAIADFIKTHLIELKKNISNIKTCAIHQTEITNGVLNLSKLDAGNVPLVNIVFKPGKAITDILAMLDNQIKAKQLQIKLQLTPELIIEADGSKFKQVIMNLLLNAIKFTEPKGLITLEQGYVTHKDGSLTLHIKIQDTGIGMDEQEQAVIFERYSKVNHSIGQDYGSSGLGLAISYKYVQLMGGHMEVNSKKLQGSTFTFTIMCKPAPSETPSLQTYNETHSFFKVNPITSKPILIVEDNLINQKVLQKLLSQQGYQTEIANDGQEAVDCFQADKYSLIFMDIVMPRLDGYKATEQIRQKERGIAQGIPIIAVSGNARNEHKMQALAVGMNDFITKPVNREIINEALAKWLTDSKPVSNAIQTTAPTPSGQI